MTNHVFVSGGAGFIGSNVAHYFLKKGARVVVFDNLSRKGTRRNLDWLLKEGGPQLRFVEGDIRDLQRVRKAIRGSSVILHEAGQVAVTHSLVNPVIDFEVNALGTLNMLEATRQECPKATFIYASTNKVYGELSGKGYKQNKTRYSYADHKMNRGVPESQPIDFHSPYGCSKGCGDQYTRDYHRVYGLKTVVFRQSCIYGPRQFGNEDQGWVMHFTKSMVDHRKLSIYGDGKQVRDILHVDDLIRAYVAAIRNIHTVAGEIFNIGGGPANTISILELIRRLGKNLESDVEVAYDSWREGDQKIYVSNISKAKKQLSWSPSISVQDGIHQLINWAKSI